MIYDDIKKFFLSWDIDPENNRVDISDDMYMRMQTEAAHEYSNEFQDFVYSIFELGENDLMYLCETIETWEDLYETWDDFSSDEY